MTYKVSNKRILIIGLGSSGKRYAKILTNLKFKNIYSYSKIKNKFCKPIKSLRNIKELNPDYILICSETHKHFKQLKELNQNLKNKKILVEKPLFHKNLKFPKIQNKIFVGYNLRFHPVYNFLYKEVRKNLKNFFDLKFICYSYLPNWKKNKKYKKTYSAMKKKGGGVINDLSHEIDLAINITKKLTLNHSFLSKISNLDLNVEDNVYAICQRKNNQKITIDLNYFTQVERRKIIFSNSSKTIVGDLINNEIYIGQNQNIKKNKLKSDHNTYEKLIRDFIFNNGKNCATFNDGILVNKFISIIKK